MKKKCFFNGISAKMALTVVALSGALLTGCYKDDGLDVNAPIDSVIIPAATYTISGTVVDAETFAPITSAQVTGGVTASVINGGFTASVSTPNTYTFDVTATGYESTTASVVVEKVNAGQSAVYSTYIALQPLMNGTYTLQYNVTDDQGNIVTNYTAEVTKFGSTEAISGPLAGGETYLVQIVAEGYVNKYITLELPKTRTNVTKVVNVMLNKVATGMVQLFGEVKVNNLFLYAQSIKLYSEDGSKLLGVQEGYTYSFEVSEDLFTTVTTTRAGSTVTKSATFKLRITSDGITFDVIKTFTIIVSADGTITPGESESENTIELDITVGEPIVNTVDWGTAITSEINYTNSSDATIDYAAKYYPYEGAAINSASNYAAVLEKMGITANSDIYEAVLLALGVNSSIEGIKLGTTEKTYTIPVPAQSILNSFTYFGAVSEITLSIKSVTVNGQEVAAFNELLGAKSVIDKATGEIRVTNTDIASISHGHGHDHGHGNGNAGGGIGDPE